jgi:predicted RNA polymerase sigma factor
LADVEDLLRDLAPQVLGVLLRRHQTLDLCEDAVQEALIAAAADWPAAGIPASPRAWLVTVATRRLIDQVRSESSRRQREDRLTPIATTPSSCCCCAVTRR